MIFFTDASLFKRCVCGYTVRYRITALNKAPVSVSPHDIVMQTFLCRDCSRLPQIFWWLLFWGWFEIVRKKTYVQFATSHYLLPLTSTRAGQVCSMLSQVRVSGVMHGFNKRSMVPGWNSISFRGRWSLQCTWGEEGQLPFYKLGVCILGLSVTKHWGDKLFGMWSSANMIGVQWSSDGAASGMGFDYARSWLLNQ